MKYCPNCGREMQDTDVFCSNCGYSHSVAQPKKESTNALLSMIFGILSFVVGGLVLSIPAIILARVSAKETGGEMNMQAKAGFICGVASTVLHVLGVLLIILIYVLMFASMFYIM